MGQPKAYLFGFEFDTRPNLRGPDFMQFLTNRSSEEFEFGGLRRLLVVEKFGDRYCGMLVTSRVDRKRAIVAHDEEGNPVLNVVSPKAGTDFADINFFIVNPNADPTKPHCRGLYVSYRGSCSTKQFGRILSSRFGAFRKSEKKKAAEQMEADYGESLTSSKQADIRKALRATYPDGPLHVYQLVDHRSFPQRLKDIHKVEVFNYSVPTIDKQKYGPGRQFVRTERRSLTLNVEHKQRNKFFLWLGKFISNEAIPSGSVSGKDESDVGKTVSLNEDVLSFGSENHDNVVSAENVRLEDLKSAPIILGLGDYMDDHKTLFGENV